MGTTIAGISCRDGARLTSRHRLRPTKVSAASKWLPTPRLLNRLPRAALLVVEWALGQRARAGLAGPSAPQWIRRRGREFSDGVNRVMLHASSHIMASSTWPPEVTRQSPNLYSGKSPPRPRQARWRSNQMGCYFRRHRRAASPTTAKPASANVEGSGTNSVAKRTSPRPYRSPPASRPG